MKYNVCNASKQSSAIHPNTQKFLIVKFTSGKILFKKKCNLKEYNKYTDICYTLGNTSNHAIANIIARD